MITMSARPVLVPVPKPVPPSPAFRRIERVLEELETIAQANEEAKLAVEHVLANWHGGSDRNLYQSNFKDAHTLPTLPAMLSRTTTRKLYWPGGNSTVSL